MQALNRCVMNVEELLCHLCLCHEFGADSVFESIYLVCDALKDFVKQVVLPLLLGREKIHDIKRSFI